MAIDGSFRLALELERFILRCGLASVPELDYLLKKGENVTEEEVVKAMGMLFLHPKYTIPMLGCFRPIAHKIVSRAMDLLRLVPDLCSNTHIKFDEDKFLRETANTELMYVVDILVRNGKGLSLHELACLAFCRALDLFPFFLGTVLGYFTTSSPPFERIKLNKLVYEDLKMEGDQILKVVRISYRFLLAKPEVFTTLWDWSCFLDFVHFVADIRMREGEEFKGNLIDICWCVTQILSVVLKTRDRASSNLSLGAEEAFSCLLRWNEFCQDVSLEKAGWFLESSTLSEPNIVREHLDHYRESSSNGFSYKFYLELHDHTSLNQSSLHLTWNSRNPFILTAAVRKSFEMVFLALSQRWPVLLYGPAGVGKTAIINKLAQDHGSQVLSIHMDEQIDGKTLLGSYVCTEQPGEFRWQPGSLTQAVSNGLWVVFEDIDKAPPDVQSILLPLLEGASSISAFHGEAIRVHERFRLFSTVSSTKLDMPSAAEGSGTLAALWRRITIGPPRDKDLLDIVNAWYPELEPLAEKLIETFLRMNQLAGFPHGTSTPLSYHGRFSVRDLLKWCKRIVVLGLTFGRDYLSSVACTGIYKEAVDVFAAYSTSTENRLKMMKEIARLWTIDNVENLYPVNRPVIQEMLSDLCIGRVTLHRTQMTEGPEKKPFVQIRSSVHVLERIACSVKLNEPVLLVGETGTGKTTIIQILAGMLDQKLTVLNLSQQSDVADLLGGFRPIDSQLVLVPLYKEFETLFTRSFSSKDNGEFLARLRKYLFDKNWKMLLHGFQMGVRKIVEIGRSVSGTKRKRPLGEEVLRTWESFSLKLERVHGQINGSDGMIFSFVEGAFVTALKNGEWILLDEINLAPPETLQRVVGVLEAENGSLCLAERGDVDYVPRHPNFRIFACMNPATDAGKRDLPFSLRSRFTEYFVDDILDDEDLILFIRQYLDDDRLELVSGIVNFYKAAKRESEERLQDGGNQKPQFSLRSLYRALEYTRKARRRFVFDQALYDGFCMFFMTLLDEPSAKLMNQLISSFLLGGKTPKQVPFDNYLNLGGNSRSDPLLETYVLTKTVKEHLSKLARAIFIGRYPVLLQGPTSSGKTSLVHYLAAITGHEFVRINNHEHTDLQEYLGTYVTDSTGKLVFHEGILVKAVRNGYWIVLDELNLAPSDVLEALNRLLDDNRELFVPELREVIHAHPDFMLFATQNPPNFYGGRKMLSRAFRNRFVEIHVDEIPLCELSTILEKRCAIPESYARKMIDVMKDLQLHRQRSKVFAGKEGYITPRDLFRWANRFWRFGRSYKDLALDGYYLLAERLRDNDEKTVVKEVLERRLGVKLSEDDIYKQEAQDGGKIIWTQSMHRLYFLVERCHTMREPVLLVGETGGGKTTVCQLLSIILKSRLHILNCHQYTETSDFLGGFYPVRNRSNIALDYENLCKDLMSCKAILNYPGESEISSDINQAALTLDKLSVIISNYRRGLVSHPDVTVPELECIERMTVDLSKLNHKWQTIFTWQDGPLVEAMKNGDLFLIDEISLADDSVLERLNSVLEPEKKLTLAEKGGSDLETVTAHERFFLLATMNPGGDYGKKELSPALRNRFTEIWVPSVGDLNELKCIGIKRLANPHLSGIVDIMLNFWEWFNNLDTGRTLTVRDFLSWVSFINVTEESLQPGYALLHGVFLVLLDGLNLGMNLSRSDAIKLMEECLSFLVQQLEGHYPNLDPSRIAALDNYGWADSRKSTVASSDGMLCDNQFGIHPFYIERGHGPCDATGFEFLAPTTRKNAMRVLRAMQLAKPVLLEGSPGVGKTSLIAAIGRFSGHTVIRINLSEQTDIMDLLGSDLPVESDEGMHFAWSDGILLQALKNGSWVMLDELNLAPQSVLEGLNAILDHRAEVFIPELGRTFKCPASFRVFACQNPFSQGGGRKGLPRSFLNRFTKVYVDELVEDDYISICTSLYPSIPRSLLCKLVLFNKCLHEETMLYHKFAQNGSPWEFNLRDVIRSCEMILDAHESSKSDCFLNTVYVQRMRTPDDRLEVARLYEQIFGLKPCINPFPRVQMNPQYLTVGSVSIKRKLYQACGFSDGQLKVLPGLLNSLEAVADCVKHQWLCILVGPPSSGKTSLIRLLAQLTGNVLNELNLSSATDISELLGCFEQYDALRNYRLIIAQVEKHMSDYWSLQFESSPVMCIGRKDLFTRWLTFLSEINSSPATSSKSIDVETLRTRCFSYIPLLVKIVEDLRSDLVDKVVPVPWSCKDLDKILLTIRKLEEGYSTKKYSAKFEWVTGQLLKAIENGEWIILENANLCNPTILDRINSLVEQSGSIMVNECGTVDGQPVVLHPHPQFRMFLTVNPSYGEVSRAMRNRGVEIYLMQPFWLIDENCNKGSLDAAELRDTKRFIILSGVPFSKLVDMMASAHIYAMHEGAKLGVGITYLELARWIQLLQQLITRGNRAIWSLQVSWEHTYLSSLGEGEGKNIVDQAISSYLSMLNMHSLDCAQDLSICLPGGLPKPLNARDFVLYSKETCVTQNCMYLEFLGAQCACSLASNKSPEEQAPAAVISDRIYFTDARRLYLNMFPMVSTDMVANKAPYNSELAERMLFFAANWAIEQATEKSDMELYHHWFSWFGSRLEPSFSFFNWFSDLLREELEHPIWKKIFQSRDELLSRNAIEIAAIPIPILSVDLVDLLGSINGQECHARLFMNSIKSVHLVRLSYLQWRSQTCFFQKQGTNHFEPILNALQVLEKKLLELLVDSPSFDVLFQLYNGLLENHILFWAGVKSFHDISTHDSVLVSWWSLLKKIRKVKAFCPEEVDKFWIEAKNWNHVFGPYLEKSLLWLHGGHPYVPRSSDIYKMQHQLLELCNQVWPRKTYYWELDGNYEFTEAVLSFNPELRHLAQQGVSMASYIVSGSDKDDSDIVRQLEEMYQMLSGRIQFEKQKLQVKEMSADLTWCSAGLSICCGFSTDLVCRRLGFSCLLDELPILDDDSFFFDMLLLPELSQIPLLDVKEQHQALSNLTYHLESALKVSLNWTSRSPTDLLPHQKLIWTGDAWESVPAVDAKVSSYVLEMWLRWHSFLWTRYPLPSNDVIGHSTHDIILPDRLFRPLKTETVEQLLGNTWAVRDYPLHSFKLRVASNNLWHSCPSAINLRSILQSAAQSLFQQIIHAHKCSFEEEKYAKIVHFISAVTGKNGTTGDLEKAMDCLASSNHQIFKSLLEPLIKPLLAELYDLPSRDCSIFALGCIWLRIAVLRYSLLVSCGDIDPAMKYSIKYSQLLEKIASLELEIEVRQQCCHLAGFFQLTGPDKYKVSLLENLQAERKRMQKQIVYRPHASKFKKLKTECDEFLEFTSIPLSWIKSIECMHVPLTDWAQVKNWQEMATCFIERLSQEYPEYTDVIEPVQVAIYEMKLGLSFIVSSASCQTLLEKVGQQDSNTVLDTVYSFMRFPRRLSPKDTSIDTGSWQHRVASYYIQYSLDIGSLDLRLLKNLVTLTGDASSNNASTALQLKGAIYKNVLLRVVHSAAETHLLDNSSFLLLNKIFKWFAKSWKHMKGQVKKREDNEAQQFKFRPRAFRIENLIELDISTLRSSVKNESFLEWQESATERESAEEMEVDGSPENLEQDWSSIEDSILDAIVDTHNQLFGSVDLVQNPGVIQVSDADKKHAFVDSYILGIRMLRNLKGFVSSSLDAKLMLEHIFRICLEHDQKFVSSHKSGRAYNFYKDSNAPMMAKMVEPLMNLKERVIVLSKEWNDHPALQKIWDAIEMILAIPLSTPLSKALSGLQFLLNRIWTLLETVAKFPLSDTLKPIYTVVSAWQKLEFESWPALLDEVEAQFENNAGRLWFPLYSVLQLEHSTKSGIHNDNSPTIQSLDEFIRTSSIGEFRRRLQLLLAFHGQINSGLCRKYYSGPLQEENMKILYNTFGFYVQFLPKILEHVGTNRRKIEEELEGHKKLCAWEQNDNSRSMENSRRARQKLRKIIQRYTVQLEQPVALHISEEIARRDVSNKRSQCQHFSMYDHLDLICNDAVSKDEDRLSCSLDGQKKVKLVLETLTFLGTMEVDLSYMEEVSNSIKDLVPPQFPYLLERRKQAWDTIGKICKATIDCDVIMRDEKKSLGKRRVFSDLLEVLETCGLSKHRSTVTEDLLNTDTSSYWLLQPSYCVQHLLPIKHGSSTGVVDCTTLGLLQCLSSESSQSDWKTANEFYFKSIISVQVLKQVRVTKDFTHDQVERSSCFLDHLISIQQEQRAAVYDFAKQLKFFRKSLRHLANLSSGPTAGLVTDWPFTANQLVISECMWQQKQHLDNWCNMLKEVHLLIETIENNHLNSCSSVKEMAKQIRLFVEKFVSNFQNSKNLLDVHLLGENGTTVAGGVPLHPYGVTKEMNELVNDNFRLIRIFEDNLIAFSKERDGGTVIKMILGNFKDLFEEAKLLSENFTANLKSRNQLEKMNEDSGICTTTTGELEAGFMAAIKETYKCVMNAFHGVLLPENGPGYSEESPKSISNWRSIFDSDVQRLKLDVVSENLLEITNLAGKLLNNYISSKSSICLLIGPHLRLLCLLLDMILAFSDHLLHDFFTMHRMVSEITHELAEVLASLFAKGYGIPEEQLNDTGSETTQDMSGTGMGEGAGVNDVSDQIHDEDQLLGTSEKPNEEDDGLTDAPGKNDKGVEMEQDFAADILSMSEESGDEDKDEDDNEGDEQLDSALGNTGANSEKVGEKSWDQTDDQNPNSMGEKYESGPSIKDEDSNDRELQAKEDPAAADDEAGEYHDEFNKQDENQNEVPSDEIDNLMDKEDAFSDPNGLKPNEQNQDSDKDVEMEEAESETMEDYETEEVEDTYENDKEQVDEVDEALGDEGSNHLVENSETANTSSDLENDTGIDSTEATKEPPQGGISNVDDNLSTLQSAEPLQAESGISDVGDVAPEAKWSNCNDMQNELAPARGLPDTSATEISVADSSEGGKLGNPHFDTPMPPIDSSSQKTKINPYRNLGDALDGWKERVKVSLDLQDTSIEDSDNLVDENANEFGYTAEFEKGTAQALGPATLDQIDKNLKGDNLDMDSGNTGSEDHGTDLQIEKQPSEMCPVQKASLNLGANAEGQSDMLDPEKQPEGSMEPQSSREADTKLSQSLVSMSRSYFSEDIDQLGALTLNEEDLGKAYGLEELSTEIRENAAILWRRYELLTTRLSQELAEQLRLVMEPTLASKLQGDYRTGKRINMKKVIPYIASHYRKDKIWLRRTRPNKRDYQVVVAVDDSRSMQENSCGNVAVEALVTVCRAMSQLEVGNLAVASFGKKGNIRMLQDFDQPFSSEAGVKMISILTFNQENTIADEPMLDLLKYLNNMLDAAVVNSRLPSGHNPLQQLVLIIADGRFHEKEKLKRCVRDLLSRKRMVAFLLLDSPEESITELMEATFQGGNVKFSKYLDSFPFPYYVVLKNIEALPRTLADLLRQWFEIMQQSRE